MQSVRVPDELFFSTLSVAATYQRRSDSKERRVNGNNGRSFEVQIDPAELRSSPDRVVLRVEILSSGV